MNILNIIKSWYEPKEEKILNNRISIEFKEQQKNIYAFIKDLLKDPQNITDVCQIFAMGTEIETEDLKYIKELEQKYHCHILGILSKQINPLSINECVKKRLYHIQNGYRFTFKNKTLDIMIDSHNNYILGNPIGKDQYILDRVRSYQGNFITSSDLIPALEAIFDVVNSRLNQNILGGELELDYNYQIDLEQKIFSKETNTR